MFLGFIKNRTIIPAENSIGEIRRMLENTWDLSEQRSVPEDLPEAESVKTFNILFKKLNHTITAILKSVVALASLAPELFRFSKELKRKAELQGGRINEISKAGSRISDRIEKISTSTGRLTDDFNCMRDDIEGALVKGDNSMEGFRAIKAEVVHLVETIRILRENSASIGSIIEEINTISDETNILSLNARIEAARGQSDGKGFKVIAEEVGNLAKQSKAATGDIQDRLTLLGTKINETVDAVELVEKNVLSCETWITDANDALGNVCSKFTALWENLSEIRDSTDRQTVDVKKVAEDIVHIESSVRQQDRDVDTIFNIAEKVNITCDDMILDTGVFHLSSHKKSKNIAEKMAAELQTISMERDEMEEALLAYLNQYGFIELAYITDRNGRQVTSNIYSPGIEERGSLEIGFGKDWSMKEWFTRPLKRKVSFVSRVYRSSATRNFCFTVSVPLFDEGVFRGVLGVDVNFKDILV